MQKPASLRPIDVLVFWLNSVVFIEGMQESTGKIIENLKRNAKRDAFVILAFSVIFLVACLWYDVFEIIIKFLHRYEKYQIDELVIIACVLFVSFAVYSLRRLSDLRVAFALVRKISETDDLTGVYSRQRILELIDQEFSRYKRYKHPFCLLFIDIDKFKAINDQFGHVAGDRVLRHVAALMRELTRGADRVGRLGGDEFLILLPETAMDKAVKMAERLRENTASLSLEDNGEDIRISLSIGVTDINEHIENIEHLVSIADRLLYAAKFQGRNCVANSESISFLTTVEKK